MSAVTGITFRRSDDGYLMIEAVVLQQGEHLEPLKAMVDRGLAMIRQALEDDGIALEHQPVAAEKLQH